jgi:MFS superfamily sulfate permease-like transporter
VEPQEPRAADRVIFLIRAWRFQMLGTILIVVLLLLLLGAWPSWPHSRSWGYYPSGTLGLVLVIVLVLALLGRI